MHRRRSALPTDPYESARIAGLRYVTDEAPGIVRKRSGRGLCYLDSKNRLLKDAETLKRIRSLVIPPAWTTVWICSLESRRLHGIGRDASGRRQFRYNSPC